MLTLKELSMADIQRAKYEKDHYPFPVIRKRFNTIYLLYLGYKRSEVSNIACVHLNSVITYLKIVNTEGLDSLTKLNYKPAKSALLATKFITPKRVLYYSSVSPSFLFLRGSLLPTQPETHLP